MKEEVFVNHEILMGFITNKRNKIIENKNNDFIYKTFEEIKKEVTSRILDIEQIINKRVSELELEYRNKQQLLIDKTKNNSIKYDKYIEVRNRLDIITESLLDAKKDLKQINRKMYLRNDLVL